MRLALYLVYNTATSRQQLARVVVVSGSFRHPSARRNLKATGPQAFADVPCATSWFTSIWMIPR